MRRENGSERYTIVDIHRVFHLDRFLGEFRHALHERLEEERNAGISANGDDGVDGERSGA